MLLLYARASRSGSSSPGSPFATASLQFGHAATIGENARNAAAVIANNFRMVLVSRSSSRWVELIQHPIHHDPRDRHVEPDWEGPAGDFQVFVARRPEPQDQR